MREEIGIRALDDLMHRLPHLEYVTKQDYGEGMMNDVTAFLLYALIKFYKPALIIHIGHLWGRSALWCCSALFGNFLNKHFLWNTKGARIDGWDDGNQIYVNPKIFSIDKTVNKKIESGLYELKKWFPEFEFYHGPSDQFFADLGTTLIQDIGDRRIMGIVDGGHEPDQCIKDIANLVWMRAEIIFCDDTKFSNLEQPVREMAKKHGYDVINFPYYTGVAIMVKKRGKK